MSRAIQAGPKWSVLVTPRKQKKDPLPEKAKDDSVVMMMPPPAPLQAVPYTSKDPYDFHTRVIMIGSLARCYDRNRMFWDSVWRERMQTLEHVSITTKDLKKGDIIFVSRDDAIVSQVIRFWTQSPFSHACIMQTSNSLIETYPNKGIIDHFVDPYVKRLVKEQSESTERKLGLWVVRLQELNPTFDSNLLHVAWNDYDSESILQNAIHMGNSDGPDHPIPVPWQTSRPVDNDHVRRALSWDERKSFSCAELIARLLDLDCFETYQWLPSTLFAKLVTLEGSQVMKIDLSSIELQVQKERTAEMDRIEEFARKHIKGEWKHDGLPPFVDDNPACHDP